MVKPALPLRRFINDRQVVRRETFTTAYRASPRVVCT